MTDTYSDPYKENVGLDESPTRHKETAASLLSPVQKNMWDSNDPMRNPPPLPLSPKMLRSAKSSPSKPHNGSPGRFQLSNVDTSEIEYQVKKLTESQASMKYLLQSIDTSVKTTQLDLESLNERSSNNNTRLKDLLQTVASSAHVETDVTQEKIHEIFSKSFGPVSEKLGKIETMKSEILSKLVEIEDRPSPTEENILSKLIEVKEQIFHAMQNQPSIDDVNRIHESIKGIASGDKSSDITKNQQEIQTLLASIQVSLTKLMNQDIKEILVSHQEQLESRVRSIHETVQASTVQQDQTDISGERLTQLMDTMKQFQDTMNDKLETISKDLVQNEILEHMKTELQTSLNAFRSTVERQLEGVSGNQYTAQAGDLLNEKTVSLGEKLIHLEHLTKNECNTLASSITELKEKSSSIIDESTRIILEKKDLELELKDSRIRELTAKLEELQSKESLQESIGELHSTRGKLESKLERLNEIYDARYNDLKQMTNEYERVSEKFMSLNIEKLQSIMNTTTFANFSNEDTVLSKSAQNGNRVLSTNSYLMNVNACTTPNTKKSYNLNPISSDDQSDVEDDKENQEHSIHESHVLESVTSEQ